MLTRGVLFPPCSLGQVAPCENHDTWKVRRGERSISGREALRSWSGSCGSAHFSSSHLHSLSNGPPASTTLERGFYEGLAFWDRGRGERRPSNTRVEDKRVLDMVVVVGSEGWCGCMGRPRNNNANNSPHQTATRRRGCVSLEVGEKWSSAVRTGAVGTCATKTVAWGFVCFVLVVFWVKKRA